jgi:DNA-binding Xre family transcriptional regulator
MESIETPQEQVRVSLYLAEALETARRRSGIRSWAEVARRSGLGATPLSQLVTGKVHLSDVRLGTVVKLCAVLDVGIEQLVQIEPAPRQPQPRADRPINEHEFALAVRALTSAPLPAGWVGPTDEDLAESPPASAADLAARIEGRDTFQQRFGLR